MRILETIATHTRPIAQTIATQTRSCTQRIWSWFDYKEYVSIPRASAAITSNAAVISVMATSTYFAYHDEYMSENPNPQKRAVYVMSMFALGRVLFNNNPLFFGDKKLYWIEHVHNWMARFAFEGYQTLLQIRANLNPENTSAIEAMTVAIQAWCAYNLAGDIFNFAKLNRTQQSTALDYRKVLTYLLRPDYDSKHLLILDAALSLFGLLTAVTGQVYGSYHVNDETAQEITSFLTNLGAFLLAKGVGSALTKTLLEHAQKLEKLLKDSTQDTDALTTGQNNPLPWQVKALRLLAKLIQRLGTETTCLLPGLVADDPTAVAVAFGVAGFFAGSNDFVAQQKIQTITEDELNNRQPGQKSEQEPEQELINHQSEQQIEQEPEQALINHQSEQHIEQEPEHTLINGQSRKTLIKRLPGKLRAFNSGYSSEMSLRGRIKKVTIETFFPFFRSSQSLAVRMNQATTATFMAGWFTWFMYGTLSAAGCFDQEFDPQATRALSTFLGGFLASAVISRLLDYFFKPGSTNLDPDSKSDSNSPIFNEACYYVLYNPYFLVVLFECLTQLVQISSAAVREGNVSKFNSICSDFALALLAILIGINQVKDYKERALLSAFARIFLIREALYDLSGKAYLT